MTESASVREGRIGPENGHALTRAVPRAGPATYKVDAGNEVEWTVNGTTTKSKLKRDPNRAGTDRRCESNDHVQEKVNKAATGCADFYLRVAGSQI